MRLAPIGERNTGTGTGSESGGDARHDVEADAMRTQVVDLFAAAPEDERIAAFQAYDGLSTASALNQNRVDLLLCRAATADILADVNVLGVAPRKVQHFASDQAIVHNHVRFLQRSQALEGEQPGIARSGP